MKPPKTQNAAVLFELLKNSSVTSIDLKQRQDIGYPNSRVSDLVHSLGLNIVSTPEKYAGKRWKATRSIARYMLITEKTKALKVYASINK